MSKLFFLTAAASLGTLGGLSSASAGDYDYDAPPPPPSYSDGGGYYAQPAPQRYYAPPRRQYYAPRYAPPSYDSGY